MEREEPTNTRSVKLAAGSIMGRGHPSGYSVGPYGIGGLLSLICEASDRCHLPVSQLNFVPILPKYVML